MKCNQSRPGFELVSPCSFPKTVTITPRAPHNDFNNNSDTDTKAYTNTYANTCKYRRTQIRTVNYFLDFSSWRQKERDTILTMLTPSQRAAHLVMFKISVGTTISFNGPNPTLHGRIPNSCLNGPISTDVFSKSSDSQDHLFSEWHHPHSSLISCLGVYYDYSDCHILCARA